MKDLQDLLEKSMMPDDRRNQDELGQGTTEQREERKMMLDATGATAELEDLMNRNKAGLPLPR